MIDARRIHAAIPIPGRLAPRCLLGFKDYSALFLMDFLEIVECERLYLVGDLIDFWSLRKGGRWPAGHGRVLKSLLAKAREGVRVIYVPGNHDEVARDYLGLLVGGIEIVPEYEHRTAAGRLEVLYWAEEAARRRVWTAPAPARLPPAPGCSLRK